MKSDIYLCEECNHKSDKLKVCCGKKMISEKKATKEAKYMCGCGS